MSKLPERSQRVSGRIDPGGLFFLLLGTLLVFLMAMISAQSTRMAAMRAVALEEYSQKVAAIAGRARSDLLAQWEQTHDDPFLLYALSNELGSRRMTFWSGDGRLVLDSWQKPDETTESGRSGATGTTAPRVTPLSPDARQRLPARGELGPLKYSSDRQTTRTFWLPMADPSNLFGQEGTLAVTLAVPSWLLEQPKPTMSWVTRVLVGAVLMLLAYYVIRIFRSETVGEGSSRLVAAEDTKQRGEFVMGTFEGLIHELKEKELELAKLRSQAEERARHIESYNENILRSVASGVLTVDKTLRITSFNKAAERILGYAQPEVVGQRPAELFGPEHPLTKTISQTLERKESLSRQELELDQPNGRVWVGMSTSLLRDQQGTTLGATVVFTDLTEIKRLEEQVELRRRLSVLGEMSAGIAHEFRNYMGTIMGYASLVSKKLKPGDPVAQMAGAITEELKSMNRLIDDLLSFGRKAVLALQETDLTDLLKRSVAHIVARGAEQRVSVTLDLSSALPPAVMLDEGLMRQALLNLLNNAIDAMPDGGTLTVTAKPLGPRDVEVMISDTGAGIASELQEKIFLPMYTTKQKGTGLGLALVHKIILSHGGRISVDSKEGGGTTFRIVLPVKPQTPP